MYTSQRWLANERLCQWIRVTTHNFTRPRPMYEVNKVSACSITRYNCIDVVSAQYRVQIVKAHFTLNKRIHPSKMSTVVHVVHVQFGKKNCLLPLKWHFFSQVFLINPDWKYIIYQDITWKDGHFTSPVMILLSLQTFFEGSRLDTEWSLNGLYPWTPFRIQG